MSASLGMGTAITMIGQLLKALFQGLSFILIARTLGSSDFGVFISILALCSLLSPFVDFGSYHLIIKRISDGENVKLVAGEAFGTLSLSAPIFVILLCFISIGIYDYPVILALMVGLTALFFDKFLSMFIALNISRDNFKIVAFIEALVAGLRFLFAILLYLLAGDVFLWVILLFVHGIISFFIIAYLLKKEMTNVPFVIPSIGLIRSGMPFVWNQVGQNANQDFDKICLSKISGADIAGIYAAAMRVLNIALIPIYAFYMAAYARYFKASNEGRHGFKHALKMLVPSASLGFITSLFVFIAAPYIPDLLGDEYIDAVELVKIAVLVPIIQTLANPFADTLSGYGKQSLRVYILMFSMVVNIVLNLLLIPDYGAYGALSATIISHIVYLIACVTITYHVTREA